MDEHGIALGVCTNALVLADSNYRRTYVKSPEDREWVSIIKTVSAEGRKLRPVIIFKGQDLQVQWFTPDNVPNWLYATSQNGWTSHAIAYQWLHQIFIPETQPVDGGARILIVDGHGSHVDIKFL
jgi:hypothetical protein